MKKQLPLLITGALFLIVAGIARITTHNHSQTQAATTCGKLQDLINAAPSGGVVLVPNCIYREAVTIAKPLILDGQNQAEVRGSDIWTGWTKSGNGWVSTLTVPTFTTITGHCAQGTDLACIRAEQVFINGVYVKQIADNLTPGPGQFSLNSTRHVVLRDDPTGKTVEVTMRRHWMEITSSNVTIKNFTMKHAATDAQDGALSVKNVGSITIQNNNLSFAHGGNLTLQYSPNSKVIGNEISFGGELGLHGNRDDNLLVRDNRIHDNNYVHYSCGWECGGIKISHLQTSIIENNQVYDNAGKGIWCDIDCNSNTYRNNRIWNNSDQGIVYEISQNAKIYNNAVWNNGFGSSNWGWGGGILVQNSNGVEVYNNILAWNADGTGIIAQDRGTHNTVTTNNLHDNVIIQDGGYALYLLSDSSLATTTGNTNANNKIFLQNGATVQWGTKVTLTNAQAETLLTANCVPLTKTGPLPCSGISPTIIVSPTQPVPTPSGANSLSVSMLLHGLGKGGDNVNPVSIGTANPLTPTRQITVQFFNSQNQLSGTLTGSISFVQSSGIFVGSIPLTTINPGLYTLKIAVPHFLIRAVPGIVALNPGQGVSLPPVALITGDTNSDNTINILDYNTLIDCFSDLSPAKNCADAVKMQSADISDDGAVNQFDYNLFLHELSIQVGQ